MRKGYAEKTRLLVEADSAMGLGQELGRLCVKLGYSVGEIADAAGVTRATVYNWFKGADPSKHTKPKVMKIIAILKEKEQAQTSHQ